MLQKKKIVWNIELIILLLLILQISAAIYTARFPDTIQIFITEIFVYSLVTLITYYMYDDKVIYADPKIPVDYTRKNLGEEEKTMFYNNIFFNFGLLKLNIFSLLFIIFMIEISGLSEWLVYAALLIFFLLMLIIIIQLIKSMLSAKGYINIPTRDILRKFTVYYNPSDKRSIVDKPLGVGTTFNLATKEGKFLLGLILGIPFFIVTLLIIILAFAGKL